MVWGLMRSPVNKHVACDNLNKRALHHVALEAVLACCNLGALPKCLVNAVFIPLGSLEHEQPA